MEKFDIGTPLTYIQNHIHSIHMYVYVCYVCDFMLTLLTVKEGSSSVAFTVKYTITSGLLFSNMVQSCMLTGDQSPLSSHCLVIMTPERKLGCNAEHRWVTKRLR